jgi:aspartyl-tRNA(Asn)/glutamyl-tRNA(Gln) amidotransferase subunit A
MKLFPEDDETIAGTAKRIRSGERTCMEVLRACLDRIDEKEPAVRAWVTVDREGAEAQARAHDDELKAGRDRGPLHGIPIGIKDIIDVAGFPTQCGLAGRRWLKPIAPAKDDAPLVARLRKAGAVILGKTVSTPFAWIDPPVTRNPWNFDRTPGGSSSGSAAAVACGMCLGAIGTQTGGSIIRPASFCGVAGMKPTYGLVSTEGIVPLARSLDHAGPIARSVADLELLYRVIREPDAEPAEIGSAEETPRIVEITGFFEDRKADPVHNALDWLRELGSLTASPPLGSRLHRLLENHRTILAAEAAAFQGHPVEVQFRFFEPEMQPFIFPKKFEELLEEGLTIPATHYINALRGRRLADFLGPSFPDFDALATPATVGPAPGTETTGDPMFNSPWSLLGVPAVSFPIGLSADGLPLAVQLIGKAGADLELLRTARWCESVIRSRWGSSA